MTQISIAINPIGPLNLNYIKNNMITHKITDANMIDPGIIAIAYTKFN